MTDRTAPRQIAKSLRFGFGLGVLAALVTAAIAFWQASRSYASGLDDLERRAGVLAYRLHRTATEALAGSDSDVRAALNDRLEGHSRLFGFAVYRADGRLAAAGEAAASRAGIMAGPVASAIAEQTETTRLAGDADGPVHVLARPLTTDDGERRGAIVALHDAVYLDDRYHRALLLGAVATAGAGAAMFLVASALAWLVFERPLHRLAEWMRRLRFGHALETPPAGLPVRRLADESVHLAASLRAARTRERSDAQHLVRSERAWTRDRLRATALDALAGHALVVVSNREPYLHELRDGVPTVVRPASGLVTALDPILRACGGLWVAHGSGSADRLSSDSSGCVPVPPEDPRYTLRRVWLSKEEEQGYYYGFSNEGLWPLCHLTHERPIFRVSDWDQYVRANQRFADSVLEEIGDEQVVVLVQDYQLALVPGMLKAKRPDLRVGLFWHIPWPNPEAFRICPYRAEILHGMLGADLIGFHLQQHCNNFLDAVDRMVEARLDWDRFAADLKGHSTLVQPFPISVQSWQERGVPTGAELAAQVGQIRQARGLETVRIGVGVDRIDYTKGIGERFRAIDRLFERWPELRGTFTFVQLGAPSRTHIPRYRELVSELDALADQINWRHQTDDWKPIQFLIGHHDGATVHAYLSMASVCVVSSLHDGMNLVAKEFVSAQGDAASGDTGLTGDGVLILSEFAGAARDLPEAIIINPYDTEEFAAAMHAALGLDVRERRQRMTRLRLRVEENNVYRWAAELLAALTQTRPGATMGAESPPDGSVL